MTISFQRNPPNSEQGRDGYVTVLCQKGMEIVGYTPLNFGYFLCENVDDDISPLDCPGPLSVYKLMNRVPQLNGGGGGGSGQPQSKSLFLLLTRLSIYT